MKKKETRSEVMNESLHGEILQNVYCTYRPLDKGEGISGLSHILFSLFTVATRFMTKQARWIITYCELLNIQLHDLPEINPSSRLFQSIFNSELPNECKLAPEHRVMLRKLRFAELGKKFSVFYGTEQDCVLLVSQEPVTCKFI